MMISANKKDKVRRRSNKCWVVRKGLPEKVAFV